MGKFEILSQLAAYKNRFASKYGIEQIGLFGSVARGEETKDSDIDIVVKLQRPSVMRCNGVRLDLEQLFHRSVDLITLHENQPSTFRNNVIRDVIYV